MATVITGGEDAFKLMAFGLPTQQAINYVENQYDRLRTVLGNAADSFLTSSYATFQKYCGDDAIRLAKAALRKAEHLFQYDGIQPLTTLAQMQQASKTMQRWIMACPEVRKLYHEQRIDGYSETYQDLQPGFIGEGHTDYEKVINGICRELPENHESGAEWVSTTYFHTDEEELPLNVGEQVEILTVWDAIRTMFKPGREDPTDPFCSKM